jgi:hypothetical protein
MLDDEDVVGSKESDVDDDKERDGGVMGVTGETSSG